MKKRVLMGWLVLLPFSLAASLALHSADIFTQAQQRVLQQRKALRVLRPVVSSVTPGKAVLIRGGSPVIVEVKGSNLQLIDSAKALRPGIDVTGITVTVDKSQLPTILKLSLKATRSAAVAKDYRLTVFDAGNNKLFDFSTTLLSIEVATLAQKIRTTTTTGTPQRQAFQPRERMPGGGPDIVDIGISGIRAPAPLKEGQMQAIEVSWKNYGGAASEDKQYLVELSYRSKKEDQWKLLTSKSFTGQLNPGLVKKEVFSLDANHALWAGEYSFRAEVDKYNYLKENDSTRANNTIETTLAVQPLPMSVVELDPIYAYPGQWTHLKISTKKNMTKAHGEGLLKFLINGKDAKINYVEDLHYENWDICAVVPQGATTGPVTLSCNGINIKTQDSLHIAAPVTVSTFSPQVARNGDIVTIQGTNFVPYRFPSDQILTSVTYGSNSTSDKQKTQQITTDQYVSDREIKFKVPPDAMTGILTVETFVEGKTSEAKTTTPLKVPPKIHGFNPSYGSAGTEVNIYGHHLWPIKTVELSGTAVQYGVRPAGTLGKYDLFFIVPKGAKAGKIKVTNEGGSDTSENDFRVLQ